MSGLASGWGEVGAEWGLCFNNVLFVDWYCVVSGGPSVPTCE